MAFGPLIGLVVFLLLVLGQSQLGLLEFLLVETDVHGLVEGSLLEGQLARAIVDLRDRLDLGWLVTLFKGCD